MKEKNKETIKAIVSILLMLLLMLGCGYMWWLEDKYKKQNKNGCKDSIELNSTR